MDHSGLRVLVLMANESWKSRDKIERTKVIGVPRTTLFGKSLRDDGLDLGNHWTGE